MEQQPLVSVVTPTYNRPGTLSELLESLSRQTYKRLQIIVVNDAGDPIEEAVGLYPELDVTIVNMESNGKHVAARNRGLSEVRGAYILLCDDDDLLLPTHVERMVREIEDCDLVYSDVEIFDYVEEEGVRRATSRFVFAYEHDLEAMRRCSTFVSSGCLYRRELHDRLGPFDEGVYNYWDWDFILRASAHYRVKRVPVASVLYAFGQSGGNMSRDAGSDSRRDYLNKLSVKHGLGELPTENFFTLLDKPEMKARRAATDVLWDGEPFVSRWASLRRKGEGEVEA
ncbi:glycosyltransferase family 2 protein [Paenibacillus validus]|uniref:Glycosyltransferase n=1 Tax=Paenibacillus validus TaxID=44253 RepID=A0A7X2ZA95_9BACL|nr:glycosyltransferase [Paenibacillus validus]MUG71209.1 glycosyltransferase [Paenibacillus validus]